MSKLSSKIISANLYFTTKCRFVKAFLNILHNFVEMLINDLWFLCIFNKTQSSFSNVMRIIPQSV